jgi:hypothetical protein
MDEYYQSCGYKIIDRNGNKGRDLELSKDNTSIKIEEKYRDNDWGDFAIEIIQDLETNNPGWFFYTKADYINYIIVKDKPTVVYTIDWKKFKEYFLKEIKRFNCFISRKGYGITLNAEIKWEYIPAHLWKKKKI